MSRSTRSPSSPCLNPSASHQPGGIDCHVHLEEPALFGGNGRSCDTFETGIYNFLLSLLTPFYSFLLPLSEHAALSGTRSAIAGGTTTIVAFAPQCKHETSLLDILDATHQKASNACYTDYSFHMLVSNPSPEVLAEFSTLRQRGISSLKIYMTYAALQLCDNQILDILLASRRAGITTMIHAENGDILTWMTDQLESRGLVAPKYHATSRPQLVETEATNRAITLSELIDAPLLIVHVSSPSAASHIRSAQTRGLPIYAETCPQYLFLTRDDLSHPDFEGAKCVCSPPLATAPSTTPQSGRDSETVPSPSSLPTTVPSCTKTPQQGRRASFPPSFPTGNSLASPMACRAWRRVCH